jgi:MFS family permease
MVSGFKKAEFKNFSLATASNFFFFCNFSSFFLLPLYIKNLGGDDAHIGYIMGSFGITSLGTLPLVTFLLDRYGRRRFMLLGYFLMFLASVSYIFLTALSPLIYALRLFQGVSFAFSFTAAGTFVADYVPSARRAQGLGIFSAFTIAAYAIGPSLGEFIMELSGFHHFFLYASCFSLISFVLAVFMKDGVFTPSRDPYGFSFFRLLSSGKYTLVFLSNLVLAGGLGAVLNFIATYFSSKGLQAYYFFLTYTITVTAIRIFGGSLSDRVGRKAVASPALFIVSVSLACMYFADSALSAVIISFVFSLGYGSLYPTLSALVIDKAGEDERGKAMGAFHATYSLGINFLAFPFGVIARDYGYEGMYLTAGVLVFAGFLLYTFFEHDRDS